MLTIKKRMKRTDSQSQVSGPAEESHDEVTVEAGVSSPQTPVWEKNLEKKESFFTHYPKHKLFATFALCFCFVSFGANFNVIGPTLSLIASRTDTPVTELGYIFTIRGLGSVVGVLAGGKLLDIFISALSRKIMVSSGIALIGSSLIGMSLSKYYLLTLALNGTAGIAAGFLNVFCNTMLGFFWGERVGMFMQLLHFSFGVGSVVAPLIVTCVTKVMGGEIRTNLWDSLTVTYMVASLLWLISIGIFAFSPEMNARKELSDESIQADLAEIAVPDQPEEKVVEDSTKPIARLRKKLTRKFVMKTLGFFLVSLVLFFYTEGIFGGLLFTYVTLKGLTDEAGAGLINSLFWLCFTCGRLVGIPVSSKVKPIYMIIFDLFGSLSAMTAMLVFRGNLTVFTVATGVLGFSYASQYPATMSLPSSFMGLKMDGMVTSLIILGPSLGGMTMPLAITSSFGVFGADGLLYGITLLCGISTFIYVIMLAFFKKKQPPVQPVQVAAVEVDVK